MASPAVAPGHHPIPDIHVVAVVNGANRDAVDNRLPTGGGLSKKRTRRCLVSPGRYGRRSETPGSCGAWWPTRTRSFEARSSMRNAESRCDMSTRRARGR
jgi:hypothetical protein